ncbi:MAG: DUF2798 domain-containing protein [Beijerinckiaceae bacterium]
MERIRRAAPLSEVAFAVARGGVVIGIPRRYSHFVFAVLQSGLTSAIAAFVATASSTSPDALLASWLKSWLLSWLLLGPVVIVAAPMIRRLALAMTIEQTRQ